MNSVTNELNTIRDLILHILEEYPETRDSDTLLYIKCCELLGVKNLEDIKKINLNIISVHKVRQKIQNKEGLFPPSKDVKELREKRRLNIRDYMKRLG